MMRALADAAARRGGSRWAFTAAVGATLGLLACAGSPAPPSEHAPAAQGGATAAVETFNFGRFGAVQVRRPSGNVRAVALYLTDDGADRMGRELPQRLAERGTLVASLDVHRYLAALAAAPEACVQPAADLENFSHYLQSREALPAYLTPVLVGDAAGAALAYATLAEAPEGLFMGAVSVGFCPTLPLVKPVCGNPSLRSAPRRDARGTVLGATFEPAPRLPGRWEVLPDEHGSACADSAAATRHFVAAVAGAEWVEPRDGHLGTATELLEPVLGAFERVAAAPAVSAAATGAQPAALADLPLRFVPAASHVEQPWFAVLLSGDGGWVGIDKGIAAALARHGIPVVGWDSLKYFWTVRTPEGAARDLARVLTHYAASLHKSRALLIGYSQGADTLPFMINRLPDATRRVVGLTALVGLSDNAVFEFHVANWLGDPPKGLPTAPELAAWRAAPYLCIYGEADADAACAAIVGHDGKVVKMRGGHHFGGRYGAVAAVILGDLPAG